MPERKSPDDFEDLLQALNASISEDSKDVFSLPEVEVDKLLAEARIDPKEAIAKVQQTLASARAQTLSDKAGPKRLAIQALKEHARRFWTHPSLRKLKKDDPVTYICSLASEVALKAMQAGWSGPPFDPIKLAPHLEVAVHVVPKADVTDARTIPLPDRRLQIEFNPSKPPARVRFSIAHELAHTLFPDCHESIRHRLAVSERQADDWQLEMLCNLAAGEFLMPMGSFPELKRTEVSIDRVLELRKEFEVSMEAVLLRVVRLTETPCAMFAASRRESSPHRDRYSLEYAVGSRNWCLPMASGDLLPKGSVTGQCTAIGYTSKGGEEWTSAGGKVHVECVGIPPFPGESIPRVVGIIHPSSPIAIQSSETIFLVGDATAPRGDDFQIIAHVVNDKTPNWGAGFGLAVRKKWPEVQEAFQTWAVETPGRLALGNVFHTDLDSRTTIFQMICQHGYGPSPTPRLRYAALKTCLERLAAFAMTRNASIHMPRIGAGQGGGSWGLINQIIDEVLCARGLRVTVYDLPNQPPPSQTSLFDLPTH